MALGLPQDPALSFLQHKIVLYYGGLDEEALPFGEGPERIQNTALRQATFLKALLLVADVLAVPPSFFFYWTSLLQDSGHLALVNELQQSGLVTSPIYSGMSGGLDFLEHKLAGSAAGEEQRNLLLSLPYLTPFFRALPVQTRNPTLQSGGYRTLLLTEVERLPGMPEEAQERLLQVIRNPVDQYVLTSRHGVHRTLVDLHRRRIISTPHFRAAYYAANRAYYLQGATTYGSAVSVLEAHRYSVFGTEMFSSPNGVVLAYDPLVLLKVFASCGIEEEEVAALSPSQLLQLRRSDHWADFKSAYREMAISAQEIEAATRRISSKALQQMQERFVGLCLKAITDEQTAHGVFAGRYDIGEDVALSAVLGGIGFLVVPASVDTQNRPLMDT